MLSSLSLLFEDADMEEPLTVLLELRKSLILKDGEFRKATSAAV